MSNNLIKVKSGVPQKADGGETIALSEQDVRHPDGHGFVASTTDFVEVFPTALVREKITKGELVEEGADPPPPPASTVDDNNRAEDTVTVDDEAAKAVVKGVPTSEAGKTGATPARRELGALPPDKADKK